MNNIEVKLEKINKEYYERNNIKIRAREILLKELLLADKRFNAESIADTLKKLYPSLRVCSTSIEYDINNY